MDAWNPSADGSAKPIPIRQLADSVGENIFSWGFYIIVLFNNKSILIL